MKKIYIILTIALLSLVQLSCSEDSMDIPQKGVLELDAFYANADDEDAISAIAAVYKQVYSSRGYNWFVALDALSDDCFAGSSFTDTKLQDFSNYVLEPTNSIVKSLYSSRYTVIYWCNLIITKMPADTAVKKRIVAEAKAVRAFCHMDLVRIWGNPVMVDHVLTQSESTLPNTPAATTWAFIEKDFTEAMSDLPSKANVNGQSAIGGRLTKEAAQALLGKAQMLQGKYAEAATTLKKVIDTKLYDLLPMNKLFRPAGDFGSEYLWEFNAADNENNPNGQGDSRYVFWGWRTDNVDPGTAMLPMGFGFGAVTGDFARFLLEHDGGKSARWYASVADYEDIQALGSAGLTVPPVTNNEGYFRMKKGAYSADALKYAHPFSAKSKANDSWMRYAEVLLMYAECKIQTSDDGSGLAALNQVRTRAGIPTLSSYTLQDLKDEKRAEMFFEGERYLDLVRWGDASTELKDKGKTWYI